MSTDYTTKPIRDNLGYALTFLRAARLQCEANGDEYWRDLLQNCIRDVDHIWEESIKPQKTEEELKVEELA